GRPKIKLPRPMINSKDYNFSFSGLKTALLYSYNDLIKKYPKKEIIPTMANEIQEAIVDVLVSKTLKAVRNFNPKSVMIAGGVAANEKLRTCLAEKIAPYHIPFFVPDFAYTTDNAAMIAAAGYFNYLKKKPKPDSWKKIEVNANLRL
ncbi:MAG: tRNA (adenosine(37)-N6)-threonylcarbamoyltransferase complex transferase subunit TsaD, partial [Patescibacteria group bacterium]